MVKFSIHPADYVIFFLLMSVNIVISIVFAVTGGRQRTTSEYFSGDRKLQLWPAALSIIVSYMSAVMIIGVPSEAYLYGGQNILLAVGTGVGTILAALFVIPVLYPLQLVSINHVCTAIGCVYDVINCYTLMKLPYFNFPVS